MGKSKVLLLLVLVAAIISGCASNYSEQKPAKEAVEIAQKSELKTVSTGSIQTGDVLIELTPTGMSDGKLQFEMAANTHSVDLSQYNMVELTTLEYDGKAIKPVSAPELSGHHTSGNIIFDAGSDLKDFKVIVKGIPNVDERVFEWS